MTMTTGTDPLFETSDLGQAAFLVALGTPLLATEPGDGRRRIFVFPPTARAAASRYFQNASVPARTFFSAIRDLKAMVQHG